ncbi:MAG TPA: MFS transporter [Patescibacteria group bacterium]|nr:MFS transporter [Patescibacteria group bacterium]
MFDGLLGYLVPLVITETGLSKTVMGIIFGSSSIFGALFDFLLSKYLRNSHFKRLFLIMFATCLFYPLVLWQAKTITVFLIAMAMWGLYYDLSNFGDFDFVGRQKNHYEHAKQFGVISVFKSLGYLLSPIIAGLLIGQVVSWEPFAFAWIILGFSISFFIVLKKTAKDILPSPTIRLVRKISIKKELNLWRNIGLLILPALILTMLLNVMDAFFWTIGPLFAENFTAIHPFNGLFLAAYTLPALLVGWMVGKVTKVFGKKRSAFFCFLIGSILLLLFYKIQNPFILMFTIFIASFFFGLSWPAINGAYADYISESNRYEKEIEGLEDFATNVGYVVGPMAAGYLADKAGNIPAFSLLGVVGIVFSLILLRFTPKSINIPQNP